MALIARKEVDVPGWVSWSNSQSLISRELRGVDRQNLKVYFQALHGLTEAIFRRSLLVGLRINQVPFKEAETWLHDHDETPDRKEFPKRFDRLYGTRGTSWSDVTSTSEPFRCALDLWHDYSKVIRNHLAHGVRRYSPEWVDCAISIDQILLIELDRSMVAVVGGSVAHSLKDLVPRLPVGKSGRNLADLMGVKSRTARPVIALAAAQTAVSALMQGQMI